MKYLIPGFIAGLVLNLFLTTRTAGTEIIPAWTDTVVHLFKTEPAPRKSGREAPFVIKKDPAIAVVSPNGIVEGFQKHEGFLSEANRSGLYYITYQKVGKEIEFFNISGERFWKTSSREYPYLSFNGKLIFLLNGDHSRIRIFDLHGNNIGVKEIAGRLCTCIVFSRTTDIGAAGFADGTYYSVNAEGQIIASGRTPDNTVVKSLAVSDSGLFLAVHYGSDKDDGLRVVDSVEKEFADVPLGFHASKAPLFISDSGKAMILDRDRLLLVNSGGKEEFVITVPPAREGQASIDCNGEYYAVAYPGEKGDARLVILRKDGMVLYSRQYLNEPYLVAEFRQALLLAKGAENLYCYTVRSPEGQ
ncbi:MAG TPA: hypothetical protein PK926_08810 [Spirochaetota bacterium]|nr:hypothetical protein [Spirochaetota bacterium]HPI88610.1 hypothetical protein [Spirochaetota bacterium]HPR48251.1 hypothetical protein [Spirochaetota bacterium]